MKEIKVYSYVIKHDTGFAPNPFHGICTLACCKPRIRKNIGKIFKEQEEEYDFWVVGISSMNRGEDGHKLVFLMRITKEPINFEEYWNNKKYFKKKANSKNPVNRVGDNIYMPKSSINKPNKASHFEQVGTSYHTCKNQQEKDIKGQYVLISEDFYYFGGKPYNKLKDNLSFLYQSEDKSKPFREKHNFSPEEIEKFRKIIVNIQKEYPQKGIINMPNDWPNEEMKNNLKIKNCNICK
jgi:hypothetical protein